MDRCSVYADGVPRARLRHGRDHWRAPESGGPQTGAGSQRSTSSISGEGGASLQPWWGARTLGSQASAAHGGGTGVGEEVSGGEDTGENLTLLYLICNE